MWKVYDSLGNYLKSFKTEKAARHFIAMNNRWDWKVKH